MPMLRLDGNDFSSGRAAFLDSLPSTENRSARIYVRVAVPGMEETFLALLEMTRLRMTKIAQDTPYSPIQIELAVREDESGEPAFTAPGPDLTEVAPEGNAEPSPETHES